MATAATLAFSVDLDVFAKRRAYSPFANLAAQGLERLRSQIVH
jgi:hypothetical protein